VALQSDHHSVQMNEANAEVATLRQEVRQQQQQTASLQHLLIPVVPQATEGDLAGHLQNLVDRCIQMQEDNRRLAQRPTKRDLVPPTPPRFLPSLTIMPLFLPSEFGGCQGHTLQIGYLLGGRCRSRQRNPKNETKKPLILGKKVLRKGG
jgi:hypothetical protein